VLVDVLVVLVVVEENVVVLLVLEIVRELELVEVCPGLLNPGTTYKVAPAATTTAPMTIYLIAPLLVILPLLVFVVLDILPTH
jgi:hypothetical protein